MKAIKALLTSVLLGAFILAGCSHNDPPSIEATGVVLLTFNNADARTVLPNAPTFTKYKLSAQKYVEGSESGAPVTGEITGTTGSIALGAGTWKITATGLVEDGKVAAVGVSAEFTVTAGASTVVGITLHAVTDEGDGVFTYTITPPSGVSLESIKLTLGGKAVTLPEINEGKYTGSESITPGVYLVKLEMETAYQSLIRTEMVHIYSNRVTHKDWTIDAGDFAQYFTLSGTIGEGTQVTHIEAYTADGGNNYGLLQGAAEVTGNAWSMALPVFDDATTLYFKGLQGTLPLKSSNTATVPVNTEAKANIAVGELSFTKTLIWQWKAGDADNFADNNNGQTINGKSIIKKGGTVLSTSDGLQMGTGRWILGYGTSPSYYNSDSSVKATTNAIYVTNAELDLSNPFKITVIYASATGSGNFYVYLNNDGSSGGNGVLTHKTFGSKNTVIGGVNPPVATGGAVVFGINPTDDLVLTTQASDAGIDKQAVLAHSFLQFRCESGISKMLITEIIIEPWATPNEPLATGVAISTTAESPITPETESGIYQAELVDYPPDGVTLTAAFTPQGAAGEAITWSIEEATEGASVSDGVVSITAAGTYTVKATSGAFSDTYKFKIHPAVSDVSISGAGSVNVGSTTITLTATVTPTDAVQGVTWSVSLQDGGGDASGVATIDAGGVLTGVAAGSVTVTATSVGKGAGGSPVTATHSVTVQEASAVTGVTINGDSSVTVGLTPIQLTATVTPDNAVQDVTWSVDTSGKATIDSDGVLTGVAAGSVTVTATSVGNGASGSPVTATKEITVNARPAVTGVTIDDSSPKEVATGKSITLHATVTPTGTLQDVTWAVSLQGGGDASGVATIDSNGVLTGVAAGSVTVTATSVGKDSDESEVASQGYEVTVKAPVAENKTWVIMEYTDATALATAGLTLGAGVEKSDISSFSFDNVVYTNRIDFKGAWSSSNTTRYISFNVSGPCIIKALLNYNASRSLVLASTLGTNLLTAGPLTANGIYSFEYKGEASTLYLYIAGNGGLSLYKLSIEY